MFLIEADLNEIAALYRIWYAMRDRCINPRNQAYKNYGKRGITVCQSWQDSFGAFALDMGLRPSSKHSLDRKENDEGYCKSNCRWATAQEQSDNRRDTRFIDGKPLSYWTKKTGLKRNTLYMRMKNGWPIERMLDPALQKPGLQPRKKEYNL